MEIQLLPPLKINQGIKLSAYYLRMEMTACSTMWLKYNHGNPSLLIPLKQLYTGGIWMTLRPLLSKSPILR